MTYVYGSRVKDKAKVAALRELIERHRKTFDALLASWVAELSDQDPAASSEDVHGRARQRAAAELVELFGEEYGQLRKKWSVHFRLAPIQLTRPS